MLRIGIAGFGFMGRMHYRCWKALADVRVVALCEADSRALGEAGQARGNIVGAEASVDLSGVNVYSELAEMLQRERLDAISLALPTFLHCDGTIEALQAGVHVLCEKPIALTLEDGQRMIDAAERCRRVLQIGHCIRFWPEYAMARQIIDRGEYGKVVAASFQRLAATAARKADTWFTDQQRSGGMELDLHIHDTDFLQHLFGMPRAVQSFAATSAGGGLTHITTRYAYDDDRLVTAEGGWAMMPSFGFAMRFHVVLQRATIDFDSRRQPTLRVCPVEGDVITPDCGPGDGYTRQIEHFARALRGEPVEPVASAREALNSLRIVEAERESARTGRAVAID